MLTILQGDAIEQLRTLPDESVHCCVTSPPYWGLRDYGTAQWEGGEDSCDHKRESQGRPTWGEGSTGSSTLKGKPSNDNHEREAHYGEKCGKCGAKRIDSQLGLEKTPEEYVAKMVGVFREVRRVLRNDGTLWLNLGDSYWGDSPPRKKSSEAFSETWDRSNTASNGGLRRTAARHGALKAKDLIGIPWRVAFALQADGWWLRSDIIWAKPNPMPESVTDRPTKSHEYLFLLTKSSNYFYDSEAIKERSLPQSIERLKYPVNVMGGPNGEYGARIGQGGERTMVEAESNRNKRSVWTVATAPYPEAHFATYPPDLIKPCILAGTSAKGCCAKCGGPWQRIVERGESSWEARKSAGHKTSGYHVEDGAISSFDTPEMPVGRKAEGGLGWVAESETIGWQPTCFCQRSEIVDQRSEPCTVLDPFAGSGTTGAVAIELGRKAILIELNPKYVELIKQRCNVTPGLQLC